MSALVTDKFRIFNAGNFVDSVLDSNNSYYVFLGLSNPETPNSGFGRTTSWSDEGETPPNPTDNLQYMSHYRDTSLFGKRVTSENIRRVVRKVEWTSNTRYEMYRHDYSANNRTPNSESLRLYDSNYYVVNKDFRVYICIDNGSSGENLRGENSKFEPTSTDLAPFSAGSDGYLWKYLFTISPNDIIKFDSSEYIILPNNWSSSEDAEISRVRDGGDSDVNENQIKKVYIESGGTSGYSDGVYNILGDGEGGQVEIITTNGVITDTNVVAGGKGYTWGVVDLQRSGTIASPPAKLIPIIPPSKGHGYDIYEELGADRVLVYARFDDSTRDFPTNTQFAQVGIIKNPKEYSSGITTYTASTYSSLYSLKLDDSYTGKPTIGTKITQSQSDTDIAKGYIASYDSDTKVLKYYQDRSLYFSNTVDQTDRNDISVASKIVNFNNTNSITFQDTSSTSVSSGFTGSVSNGVNLGVNFTGGLANPEINKKTGDIIYIDNRPTVERNIRQKEDIKIILEF